jgi:hypothetical protein
MVDSTTRLGGGEEDTKLSQIETIPDDIFSQIVSHLDAASLLSLEASQTSSKGKRALPKSLGLMIRFKVWEYRRTSYTILSLISPLYPPRHCRLPLCSDITIGSTLRSGNDAGILLKLEDNGLRPSFLSWSLRPTIYF